MITLDKEKGKNYVTFLFLFMCFYLLLFIAIAYQKKNVEFLYYSFIIFFILILGYKWSNKIFFPIPIYVGFALLGLMHLAGGNLIINGVVLYEHHFGILEYDNIVHPFGTFVATLALYNLFKHYLKEKIHETNLPLYAMLFLMAMGIGALVEITEFFAFETFKDVLVGDYVNNALDLVFNAIGSLIACGVIYFDLKKRKKERNN